MIACVQLPGDSEKKMIKWYTELALKGQEDTMNIPEYIFYLLLEHDIAGQDKNSVQSMQAAEMFINGEGQNMKPIVKLELTDGKIIATPRPRKRKGRSTKTLASAEANTSSTNDTSSTPKKMIMKQKPLLLRRVICGFDQMTALKKGAKSRRLTTKKVDRGL